MLIPGGRHKMMEEAKNSRDIHLRFKRLEKVLEINQSLNVDIPSRKYLQTDQSVQSRIEEEKSTSKENHVLNETFVYVTVFFCCLYVLFIFIKFKH